MSPEATYVELLESTRALDGIAPEWAALHRRSERATVFQSPTWALGCVHHLAGGAARVAVARRGGRLVGVLPLVAAPSGVWSIAGTGPSDVLDLLAQDADGPEVARAVLAHVAGRGDWQVLELHELRADSPLLAAARAEVAGPVAVDAPLSVCPTLAIPPGATDLDEIVPGSWARRLRRDRRAAVRAGLRVQRAPPSDARAHVASWGRLHAARWRSRGEPGVLRGREAFDRDVVPRLLRSGDAELLSLCDGSGDIRASCLVFRERARAAYYLGGFDPAIGNRSPLVVLVAEALEQAARDGARELDFLRGAEAYKYRWGAVDRTQYRVRIERG